MLTPSDCVLLNWVETRERALLEGGKAKLPNALCANALATGILVQCPKAGKERRRDRDDRRLDEKVYIVPGLGEAGDRWFGTG